MGWRCGRHNAAQSGKPFDRGRALPVTGKIVVIVIVAVAADGDWCESVAGLEG